MIKYLMPLINHFRNINIREKMLFSYIALIFIPVVLTTFLYYNRSAKIIEETVTESTNQAFDLTNTFMLYKMNYIKDISSMLYMNKDIQKILLKPQDRYPLSEQIDDYNKLLDIIRPVQNNRGIYKIRLFVKNDTIYSNEGTTIISESQVKDLPWYKKVTETGGIYWKPTYEYEYGVGQNLNHRIISCVRTINDEGYTDRNLGVISIDILEDSIYQIIKQTSITARGEIYLTDEDGNIISCRDKSKIGTKISLMNYSTDIKDGGQGYKKLKIDNEMSIVCYKTLESTNWHLVAVIPLKEIVFPTRQILSYLVFVVAIVIVIAIAVAYYISDSITKRIRQLIKNMKEIGDDNWDIYIPVDSKDEIGVLQRHFNHMMENMRLLIKERYVAEINKKSAELKALQAQINPHFLYNTLDLIKWMALKYKAQDISYIVSSLAKFFKLSLSGGRDIVTIGDEITHVKTYLSIQNSRFGNSINVILDIAEELNYLITVKLILQPIVENSIIHGIQEKNSKEGFIKIEGKLSGGLVVLTIEDNGVGVGSDKLDQLLNKSASAGYGIKNVNERIKMYFGQEYGLKFESEKGSGTKVTVKFPAVQFDADKTDLE